MYNTLELAEKQINTIENKAEALTYEVNIPKLSTHVIMATAASIGIWGTTCLINGLVGSNDLQELGRGLVTALIGI